MELRQNSGNPVKFDEELYKTTQFYTPDSSVVQDAMWIYFDDTIGRYLFFYYFFIIFLLFLYILYFFLLNFYK